MWLIDRDSDGSGSHRIALPAPLRAALVRWYTGLGSHHDEQAGITLVQNARIGRKWIACDCLAADENPPILTPAFLSEAETYYLRRLTSTKRPEHRADCPFFRDQITNRITEVRSPETPADPPGGYFEVLRPAPEKLAQRPEEESTDDRTRNASIPRLARLLWRLMDLAGVNRIAPLSCGDDWTIKREFEQLVRASAQIEIAPGIELGRALWTHARPLHTNAVYAHLRHLAREWPRGHAPQGFVILFSPSFSGHDVATADTPSVRIANRVQSASVRGNPIKGPYLTIVVAGEYPEAHGYAPLRAYAQPILSGRQFVPIDSEFERLVLKELLACQHMLHRRGVDTVIEKPLFDTLTAEGPCRPDFLLEARSRLTGEVRTVIVEAMGAVEDVYRIAKIAAQPRIERLGPTVLVEPSDLASGTARERILAALDPPFVPVGSVKPSIKSTDHAEQRAAPSSGDPIGTRAGPT